MTRVVAIDVELEPGPRAGQRASQHRATGLAPTVTALAQTGRQANRRVGRVAPLDQEGALGAAHLEDEAQQVLDPRAAVHPGRGGDV
jgi:hypothetical protein